MAAGTTRRTSRVTSRTSRAGGGGGGPRGGSAMGLIVAIVIVVLLLGMLAVYLQIKGKQELEAANRTTGVVAAAVDLPAGHQITPQDVTIKQVKADSVENGAFVDAGDPSLIGGTLVVNVAANQTVLRNFIGQPEEKLLPNQGESLESLVLKGPDAVKPFLMKGRIVSIFRVYTTSSGNRITKSLSKYARILEVRKSDSVVANAQNSGEPQAIVTLALSPTDAQQVSAYADQAKLLDGANQEPPLSNVTLFQQWMGIEKEESELTQEVGSTLVVKEEKK